MDEDGCDSSRIRFFYSVTTIDSRWNVVQWWIVDIFICMVYRPNWGIFAFKFYRRPPDHVKCLVE